jgi:hypothetical protein
MVFRGCSAKSGHYRFRHPTVNGTRDMTQEFSNFGRQLAGGSGI